MRGQLDQLVEWMRDQGVRRLRMPDGIELELDPFEEERRRNRASDARVAAAMDGKPAEEAEDRPAPLAQALADVDGAGVCSCGHSWLEHNVGGCLFGCSHETCASREDAEPEPLS